MRACSGLFFLQHPSQPSSILFAFEFQISTQKMLIHIMKMQNKITVMQVVHNATHVRIIWTNEYCGSDSI